MTHSSSVVVPHGGKRKYFGTNPVSFAFARKSGEPVCLDMATSQVAWNKVLNARIEGRELDPGIAVDEDGVPTTDAQKARAGIPLGGPIYGYKGYGLAFVIDLLCGLLNGMTFGATSTACTRTSPSRARSATSSWRSIPRDSRAATRWRRRSMR
jgi:ureidoglycolate dehydrogenase (NAD+)